MGLLNEKKFAVLSKALLAGTCLTAATGVNASASIVVENQNGVGTFSTNASNPTLLPLGTSEVQGTLVDTEGGSKYFTFEFTPGATVDFSDSKISGPRTPEIFFYDGSIASEGNYIPTSFRTPATGSFVTSTGFVTVDAFGEGGFGPVVFDVALSNPNSAPEPGTLGLGAAALAGGLLWNRRRKGVC